MQLREDLPRLNTRPVVEAKPIPPFSAEELDRDYFADVMQTDEIPVFLSSSMPELESTAMIPFQGEITPVVYERSRDTEMVRYSRSDASQDEAERTQPRWINRILWQSAMCMVILLMILLFRQVDLPVFKTAVNGVKVAVTTPADFDDTLGQLKYVQNLLPQAAEVFLSSSGVRSMVLSPPVSGRILQGYEKGVSDALSIDAGVGMPVYAVAQGTVLDLGASTQWGNYLRIDHGNGAVSVYGNIAEASGIQTGTVVDSAQPIGTVGEQGVLYYELQVEGYAVDPLPRMTYSPPSEATQ